MAASPNAAVLETAQFTFQTRQRGLWQQAFDRLKRNTVAIIAAVTLISLSVLAFTTEVAPAVERYPAHEQQFDDLLGEPSSSHWLGTDNLSRDTWSRVWEGTRISLKIGVGTQVVVLIVGLAVGACAALGGRLSDNLLMRFTDLIYAFPDLLTIILMRAILTDRDWPIIGSGNPQIPGFPGILLQVIIAIGIVSWVTLARLVRGQMLDLRNADYVLAARSIGANNRRIVLTHMLPNTLGPVIIAVTFGIPAAIFAETFLGFIGFGLPPPYSQPGHARKRGPAVRARERVDGRGAVGCDCAADPLLHLPRRRPARRARSAHEKVAPGQPHWERGASRRSWRVNPGRSAGVM